MATQETGMDEQMLEELGYQEPDVPDGQTEHTHECLACGVIFECSLVECIAESNMPCKDHRP
jgi:hypothetical protein